MANQKNKPTSLHAALAVSIPFVAFEFEDLGHFKGVIHARTIEDGAMLHGESVPMYWEDINSMQDDDKDDVSYLDRLEKLGPPMCIGALEELGESFDVENPIYLQISTTIDWLRSIY